MAIQETLLTPELAATLLGQRHPKQRRPARSMVAKYARTIREGRWMLSPDPLLIDQGRMFNGGHRCEAVILAKRPIPVYIDWDASADLFNVIDVGRPRSAYQFLDGSDANTRAAAARFTLWYERRFEQPPAGVSLAFDMSEVITEVERRDASFDVMMPRARRLYEYTSISRSVALAAFAIAYSMGYEEQVEEFVAGVEDPGSVDINHPARMLGDRFRRMDHRRRRRQPVEDWGVLVRSFNLYLQDLRPAYLKVPTVWPRVAEDEQDHRRRANTVLRERERAGVRTRRYGVGSVDTEGPAMAASKKP